MYTPAPRSYPAPAPAPYGGQAQSSGTSTANSAGAAASTGLAGGQIAGIVIGCLLAAAIVAFVAYRKFSDKKREEQMFGESAELENPDSAADYAAM